VRGELSIDSAAAPPARPPNLWATRLFTHRFSGRPINFYTSRSRLLLFGTLPLRGQLGQKRNQTIPILWLMPILGTKIQIKPEPLHPLVHLAASKAPQNQFPLKRFLQTQFDRSHFNLPNRYTVSVYHPEWPLIRLAQINTHHRPKNTYLQITYYKNLT
jgi:hypothetical protein